MAARPLPLPLSERETPCVCRVFGVKKAFWWPHAWTTNHHVVGLGWKQDKHRVWWFFGFCIGGRFFCWHRPLCMAGLIGWVRMQAGKRRWLAYAAALLMLQLAYIHCSLHILHNATPQLSRCGSNSSSGCSTTSNSSGGGGSS